MPRFSLRKQPTFCDKAIGFPAGRLLVASQNVGCFFKLDDVESPLWKVIACQNLACEQAPRGALAAGAKKEGPGELIRR